MPEHDTPRPASPDFSRAGRGVLIAVPTYNEAGNIESIVGRARAAVPDADIVIVDDNSTDGTAQIADRLAQADRHVHVMHRPGKAGLGAAYLAAFAWARKQGYGVVVEMDADGSHQPEHLPAMLATLGDADAVLGSRWVPGGGVVNWPKRREWLSRGGSRYARLMLGVPIADVTGGFRAYRIAALDVMDLPSVDSKGYCFQIDMARRAVAAGLRVVEVPITFVEREIGESKMSGAIVGEALWQVTRWGVARRLRPSSP